MGWSKKGLKAIADIRIYCQNGGKITPNHFTKAKQQYNIKLETIKKAKEVFSKTTYEKLNNIPVFNMGKKTRGCNKNLTQKEGFFNINMDIVCHLNK